MIYPNLCSFYDRNQPVSGKMIYPVLFLFDERSVDLVNNITSKDGEKV